MNDVDMIKQKDEIFMLLIEYFTQLYSSWSLIISLFL